MHALLIISVPIFMSYAHIFAIIYRITMGGVIFIHVLSRISSNIEHPHCLPLLALGLTIIPIFSFLYISNLLEFVLQFS